MSKHNSAQIVEASCTEKCRLKDHGKYITSAITKFGFTDYQIACYISAICKNFSQVLDYEGRNALHVASSCGRRDLCQWLVQAAKADINAKDLESGYTPLHRSIFYGHINNAVSLIEMGAQTNVMDKDDLLATEHAMKDRLIKEFSAHNPCQAYVWGTNNNYTLGTGNQHSRGQPELLDFFRKNCASVNQVAIDKFHSVFVSTSGQVWSCGHGQGGRLGVDSEHTVLTPQPVKTGSDHVVSASVGRNHTVLLMDSGQVWTCGSNSHHVLGHTPPPGALLAPRPIHARLLKPAGGPIVGVAAAHYHTVVWSNTVMLTFGLNAGQLGHQLPDKTIIAPKQVTGLNQKSNIVDVAASVGATVVCQAKGDIHILCNYQIRRIASKILDVTKIAAFGGELNAELDQKLSPKGGDELKVLVLTSRGQILLWQESFPQVTRCIHPMKRSLTFSEISLSRTSALLVTQDGESYTAHFKSKNKKKIIAPSPKTENLSFNQFLDRLECHHMTINRVPHVHRAVGVAADPKGHNFVVIQENPKVNLTDIPIVSVSEFNQQMRLLLEDAREDDSLHDVLIKVDNGSVAAHHFILALASEEFAGLPRKTSVAEVTYKGVNIHVLNQVLLFAYTHDCDIIRPGPFQAPGFSGDIIKAALDLAKRLKMQSLLKCLKLLRWDDGLIVLKEGDLRQAVGQRSVWSRTMFPALHDVSISSNDGASFKAHKCVLAARLDYFNSMFTGGWVEAEATTSLSLPIPQTILREVIDFLYSDEAKSLAESQDVDYVSSVLVVADQLFIKRLKEICEVALSGSLNLRNAAYLMQLAITYNADQLKNCCMQFICLNLAAILESRILEILDKRVLEELSEYYRNLITPMSKRIMTPFTTVNTEDEIIEIADSNPVTWINLEGSSNEHETITCKVNRSNPSPITGKKKTPRNRRSSESQRKRFESVSSNSDLDCSIELTPTEKFDFDDLVERNKNSKTEEWVTVDKVQKTVQNRLKVISAASTIQPLPDDFTQLTPIKAHHVGSPPLPRDSKHFPELSSISRLSSSPKSSYIEIKRTPMVKLSQKQRKKLLAEGGTAGEAKVEEGKGTPPARTPWAVINNNTDCSLGDIMRSALTVGSPPNSQKNNGLIKFADIVADEKEQRDNWSRMKSKSLQLTQIEDKAMEELAVFYNAASIFDERITVERVLSANIAKPIWITSHH